MKDATYVVVQSMIIAMTFGVWQHSWSAGSFMFCFNACFMFEFRSLLIWLRRP
jgi:hypothetical protein